MKKSRIVAPLMAAWLVLPPIGAEAQTCAPVQPCGDVNASAKVTAADALLVLKKAVGVPVGLSCECSDAGTPACAVPVTGQTTAYGAGSDGDLERGALPSFTDNGDGTITDNTSGLMWEKKSDDGSAHDWNNTYAWSSSSNDMNGPMVTSFLAALNSGSGFAGYTDWRIPNVRELQTLVDFEYASPAATIHPEFQGNCTPGCSVTECSCTIPDLYFSATSNRGAPENAWLVQFGTGATLWTRKTYKFAVRAVRAGA